MQGCCTVWDFPGKRASSAIPYSTKSYHKSTLSILQRSKLLYSFQCVKPKKCNKYHSTGGFIIPDGSESFVMYRNSLTALEIAAHALIADVQPDKAGCKTCTFVHDTNTQRALKKLMKSKAVKAFSWPSKAQMSREESHYQSWCLVLPPIFSVRHWNEWSSFDQWRIDNVDLKQDLMLY
jgi:hypothetical protein